jgi:hypothetical protein
MPVAAPGDDARRTAGKGAMADRMQSHGECDDAFEEGEEGRNKEGANVAYRLFHSFRQW